MRHIRPPRLILVIVLLGAVGCSGVTADLPTLPPAATPTATAIATATPTAPPTATPTVAATATPTAAPTATPPPPGATPTMSPAESWAALYAWSCTRVRHTSLEDFVSYLEWGIGLHEMFGVDPRDLVDYIEITVIGANDDEPEVLEYDAEFGFWFGFFGLRNAGAKTIVNVQVHWQDGSVTDATERFIEDLGTDTFDVRYPQEDEFGDCADMPPVSPT